MHTTSFGLLLLLVLTLTTHGADKPSAARPPQWATPVENCPVENAFKVSDDLFRSEQPSGKHSEALGKLGIRTILNLREYHTDSSDFTKAGLTLVTEPMDADDITTDQLVSALRKFRTAKKPVLVHCWHGSDRTGAFVAAYRIVFQDWTKESAIEELRLGGFGYHEKTYPNIKTLIGALDVAEIKKRVLAD